MISFQLIQSGSLDEIEDDFFFKTMAGEDECSVNRRLDLMRRDPPLGYHLQ